MNLLEDAPKNRLTWHLLTNLIGNHTKLARFFFAEAHTADKRGDTGNGKRALLKANGLYLEALEWSNEAPYPYPEAIHCDLKSLGCDLEKLAERYSHVYLTRLSTQSEPVDLTASASI
jgi:hypothetical protein